MSDLYLGEVPSRALDALDRLWAYPETVSSNFAREYAEEIALLASMGWISTIEPGGLVWSRAWRITRQGHAFLRPNGGLSAWAVTTSE